MWFNETTTNGNSSTRFKRPKKMFFFPDGEGKTSVSKIMDVFLCICTWLTLQNLPNSFTILFLHVYFLKTIIESSSRILALYTQNAMLVEGRSRKDGNNCQQWRKNKYFVRDIYFISGIIYDFQTRNNFSVFFLFPPSHTHCRANYRYCCGTKEINSIDK
jgi:hypothetical protein